ncbi:hypothetical protein AB1P65_09635 [Roseibium alexandrii]
MRWMFWAALAFMLVMFGLQLFVSPFVGVVFGVSVIFIGAISFFMFLLWKMTA